jgi:adenosylmethionine-8-amino-7-oxononanoate aminotransferase
MEEVLDSHCDRLAAVIMEPLLLAAGGMITYSPDYLAAVAEMARHRDIHLILDEVATGFGRTGTMFACEQAGVSPDFLCLSKGITSGTLPFAATLVAGHIYESFLSDRGKDRTFYHGHTYTANPVGCAAALANLDLFEENQTLGHVRGLAPILHAGAGKLRSFPQVGQVRCLGMVAAIELVQDRETKKPVLRNGALLRRIYREGLEQGILLRPIGNVIYLMPPLCTTEEQLRDILHRTEAALENVLRVSGPP